MTLYQTESLRSVRWYVKKTMSDELDDTLKEFIVVCFEVLYILSETPIKDKKN
jgi:hypothetical protein